MLSAGHSGNASLLNANGKLELRLNDGGTFCARARGVARGISDDIHHAGLVEGTK
jgi:hypothetical protein